MRELKEVNYLFSTIPDTRVYLMAGNHDFISRDSFYRTFEWNSNVTFFKNRELTCVKDPELDVYVYGLSYYDREIREGLYDKAVPVQEEGIHILLAHGGDEKHIPLSAASLAAAGFDYVALGHIHKPQILIRDQAAFSGALEPIDRNDTGEHGYMEGRVVNGRIRTEFVPFACRSYQQLVMPLHEETTQISLEAEEAEAEKATEKELVESVSEIVEEDSVEEPKETSGVPLNEDGKPDFSATIRMPELKIPKSMINVDPENASSAAGIPDASGIFGSIDEIAAEVAKDKKADEEPEKEQEFNLEDTILAAASEQGINIPEEEKSPDVQQSEVTEETEDEEDLDIAADEFVPEEPDAADIEDIMAQISAQPISGRRCK